MHSVVVFAFRKPSCDGSQLCDSELQFMFTEKRSANVFLTNSERCSCNVNRVYHRKDRSDLVLSWCMMGYTIIIFDKLGKHIFVYRRSSECIEAGLCRSSWQGQRNEHREKIVPKLIRKSYRLCDFFPSTIIAMKFVRSLVFFV